MLWPIKLFGISIFENNIAPVTFPALPTDDGTSKDRRREKVILVTVLMVFGLALISGCISTQTRSDHHSTIIEESMIGDRIVALQRRINDVKTKGLPASEWQVFQFKLDGIRGDYSRMRERDRYPTYEERRDISQRIDQLEKDLYRAER